ncbi:MAG: PepSY domain-containing protein [Caulobacteraceae bacterium]|nr:PepSY domain-containing protein [Caulobacteraceae bacterium]
MTQSKSGGATPPPLPLSGAYRAVWRWHFYAGLLVLPFLMLMALTGGIYLFKAEIDDWQTRSVARIQPGPVASAPADWVAAATTAVPGRAATVLVPERADRAVQVTVETADGARRVVFVDPKDARVTGDRTEGGISETVKRLHSLVIAGPQMNLIVEIVAGWAMILVATGLFLWWPRRREAGVVTIKGKAGRPLWRDVHAVTGLYAGGVIFFLAFTGMPWSAVWGDGIMGAVREAGLGRPAAPTADWLHAEHGDAPPGAGWAMEHATLHATPAAVDLNAVVATVEGAGLARPYVIGLPASPDRAITAAVQNRRAEAARLIYLRPGGGVLADVKADQFGIGARAFEWGIAVHEGRQYGPINRWIMLAACVSVWVLGISALTMWWTRRPKGRLGAPTAPPGPRVRAAVLGIVIPFCIVYPLTGLSLLAALAVDRLWGLTRRRAAT